HEHLTAGRFLEAAGDRQERALAGSARAHDRDELSALDGEIEVTQRAHLGRPGAVDLGYLAKFERAGHCVTSIGCVGSSGVSATAGGARDGRCFKRTSAASSQRTIASSRNSSASATSANAMSPSPAAALTCVYPCMTSIACRRCTCRISWMSIPGICNPTSTLITSSSRGGGTRAGGVRSQSASSWVPADVVRYRFLVPSLSPSSVSTSPSRSRRWRVVYTCPTLRGQTSPVRASNSFWSRRPYFGPSLSKARRA